MKKNSSFPQAAGPALALVNALVVAQASAADPSPLTEVVVEGQGETSPYQAPSMQSAEYPMPVLDTPRTINIIPQQMIQDQNATSLRDVLRNVSGISYQAGEGGGGPAGDRFTIRGFNAAGDIFVDGVRDFGGYSRDPFNFEQVEVVQGPASSYNGRGSTGGAINIVSKTPRLENFYNADFGIGTNDYYRVTVDINQTVPQIGDALPGVAFRLNAMFHTQEFANRGYVSDERWGVAPSISFGLGTETRATLSYMHLQQDNLPSYGVLFVPKNLPGDPPIPNPYGGQSAAGKPAPVANDTFFGLVNRDYEETYTDIVNLDLEHDFSDDLRLTNQTRFGRNFRDSIITAPRLDAATQLINRQLQSRYQTDTIVTNLTTLSAEFETWTMKHFLVASFEYDYEYSENEPRAAGVTPPGVSPFVNPTQANPYNPDPYQNSGTWGFTGGSSRAWQNTSGLSLFDTIEITEQWLLTLGMRLDYYTVSSIVKPGTVVTTSPPAVYTEQNENSWEPTWSAGLAYKPVPSATLYFNYATSYNPAGELLVSQTTPFNLQPERSESFELGAKWDVLKNQLSLTGALFQTNKTNARTTNLNGDVTTTGEARVRGFQLGVNGNVTKDWAVYAGYTYLDSDILKDKDPAIKGNELAQVPEQTFAFWTTYQLPYGFEVGTGVTFVDQRYSNNLNSNSVPQYTLQDALLSYKINDNATVQLNVTNLWNEDYYDRIGGGHAIPGVGRTFVVSSQLRF